MERNETSAANRHSAVLTSYVTSNQISESCKCKHECAGGASCYWFFSCGSIVHNTVWSKRDVMWLLEGSSLVKRSYQNSKLIFECNRRIRALLKTQNWLFRVWIQQLMRLNEINLNFLFNFLPCWHLTCKIHLVKSHGNIRNPCRNNKLWAILKKRREMWCSCDEFFHCSQMSEYQTAQ